MDSHADTFDAKTADGYAPARGAWRGILPVLFAGAVLSLLFVRLLGRCSPEGA